MNYRHAFHAGNFADVVKHAVLARILTHLALKDAPIRVLDTHAGCGLYDLASDEALRTGEARAGVMRVAGADLSGPLADFLAPWRAVLQAENGGDALLVYPGSPVFARRLARPQDRLIFNELNPLEADQLAAVVRGDRRVRVTRRDGFEAVRAEWPPPERRGLVVIDPPFEVAGEFDRLARAMTDAARRFATGIVLLWYPIKDPAQVARFHDAVAASGLARILRIEHWTRRTGGEGPLAGAGMLVLNPPWTLAAETEAVLPELVARLGEGPEAGGRVDWLVAEKLAGSPARPAT